MPVFPHQAAFLGGGDEPHTPTHDRFACYRIGGLFARPLKPYKESLILTYLFTGWLPPGKKIFLSVHSVPLWFLKVFLTTSATYPAKAPYITLGWPVEARTAFHTQPSGSIFFRVETAREMGTCVNSPLQSPTTMLVRPAIPA